ncbi:MAG: AmmeMemoRadiSam system protein B [Pseudomonadota bacterium]|nr:AmmeMemoRadiSam system protein B [Pseudomonadota bacterium]
METTRQPAVAGVFYPGDASVLQRTVSGLLHEAGERPDVPKAIIAPHAGYIYSGEVAASAYRLLASRAGSIRRVVMAGPSHRVGFRGIAVPESRYFMTPLGRIPVDTAAIDSLADFPWVQRSDAPHAQEHCLEVQLPFLQTILDEFTLVPLVVGQAEPAQVDAVLEHLWGGDETVIVISSDLSHYLPYAQAKAIDARTSSSIEALREEEIGFDQACGALPVRGLLMAARSHGLHCTTVDQRNSGDTAGPRDRVVGYGAYVFE